MKTCLALLLASSAAAQGTVIVVDDVPGPGVDTTSLQDAIDGAPDGATILVKPGEYSNGFAVSAKSLAIVGEQGTPPQIAEPCAISALAAGQRVVLRGVRIAVGSGEVALQVAGNDGHVWIEDVVATAEKGGWLSQSAGIGIADSQSVALLRVTCSGGVPGGSLLYPTGGLVCSSSSVSMYESVATGVAGSDVYCTFCGLIGADGADGVVLDDSFLLASGSIIRGGQGGSILEPCCAPPCFAIAGDGGPGLRMQGTSPEAWLLATAPAGGPAGTTVGCGASSDGPDVLGGTPNVFAGQDVVLVASSPVRELETLGLQVLGPAGSPAFLAVGLEPASLFLPPHQGTLLVAASGPLLGLGTIPPSGVLNLLLTAPVLPVGFESLVLHGQSAVQVGSSLTLGAAASVVVLDSAF